MDAGTARYSHGSRWCPLPSTWNSRVAAGFDVAMSTGLGRQRCAQERGQQSWQRGTSGRVRSTGFPVVRVARHGGLGPTLALATRSWQILQHRDTSPPKTSHGVQLTLGRQATRAHADASRLGWTLSGSLGAVRNGGGPATTQGKMAWRSGGGVPNELFVGFGQHRTESEQWAATLRLRDARTAKTSPKPVVGMTRGPYHGPIRRWGEQVERPGPGPGEGRLSSEGGPTASALP